MKILLFLLLIVGLWGCLGPGINPGNQSTTPADPDGGVLGPISLNSFTPSVGPQGTKLTISGSNFSSGVTVTVGETACTDVSVTSSELLTCTVGGNSPGQQTVTVTSTGGVSTSFSSKFTSKVFLFVISGPTILKIRSYDIKTDGTFPTALETTTQTDPEILAIHPEGKYLYVIPSTGTDFASYTINLNTGALTELQDKLPLTDCTAGHNGSMAANGNYLVVDCGANGIRSFPVNPTDGTLGTTAAATTNLSGGTVVKMTTSAKGKFVHILTSSSKLESFELNSNTGALTSLGSPVASDYNSASKLLSLLDSFLYFAPTNDSKLAAYSIANNGVPSLLVNSNLNSTPVSFDITSNGSFLYTLDQTNGILKGYSLSSGGSPTYSGDFTETINTGSDLTVGPGNTFVFAGDTNQSKIFSYTVNKSDGSLTEQSSTAIDISPVRFFIK